jgi:hypothetical protein
MNYRRSKAGVETPRDRHLRSMLLDSTPYQYEYVFVANCDNGKSVVLQPLVYPLHNPGLQAGYAGRPSDRRTAMSCTSFTTHTLQP